MEKPAFSLVVPTLNAASEIDELLTRLEHQVWEPDEILVVDSASTDDTAKIVHGHPSVKMKTISRSEFDHGGTRNWAANLSACDYVLFLTQDAMPADEFYTKAVLKPFEDPAVALVSGRQLPKADARRFVQLIQEYNYPAHRNVRVKTDVERMGIKAFFCSDSCSAYRKSALEKIGGVPMPCSTNEDMLAAARFLCSGYKVVYEPSARVYHSHNFSLKTQFLRNREVGFFLRSHHEELMGASEVGEGFSLVQYVGQTLIRERRYLEMLAFCMDCVARLLGNRMGRLGMR